MKIAEHAATSSVTGTTPREAAVVHILKASHRPKQYPLTSISTKPEKGTLHKPAVVKGNFAESASRGPGLAA